jgi:peptidylprolyl isomerase
VELLLKLLLLGVALVGGQGHASPPHPTSALPPPQSPQAVEASESKGRWVGLWRTAQGARHPERLVFPEGGAPKKLIVKTLQVGDGEELKRGDSIVADYRAFICRSGKLWEDYWQEGFSTRFGAGENVKGWEIGLAGMRVGGWLELIVPSPMVHNTVALVYVVRLREIT